MIVIVRTHRILKYCRTYYANTTGLQKNIYENRVTCQNSLKHSSQKKTHTSILLIPARHLSIKSRLQHAYDFAI